MRRKILAVAVLALVATACGSSIEKGSYSDETRSPSPIGSATVKLKTCPAATAVTVAADTATNLSKKPRLVLKTAGCAGITTLYKKDLVVGSGAVVKVSDTVRAHYVGVGWDSRKQFDASWDRGQPIDFPLNGVIKGWTQGIPGMRVGGRRLLVIPGTLAYGSNPPQGASIGINETLIFVVDIKAVNPPSNSPTPASS